MLFLQQLVFSNLVFVLMYIQTEFDMFEGFLFVNIVWYDIVHYPAPYY